MIKPTGGKQMKRLIVGMVIAFMLAIISIVAQAEGETTKYGFLNLNGVTYYLPNAETFAVGAGIEVASIYDGLLSIRAEAVTAVVKEETASDNYIGVGVGLNIPKVIAKLGGSWVADKFNPSVNIAMLSDMDNGINAEYAIGLNVIQIPF